MQGARIPDSAFVDSLDIIDADFLDVGEEVAIAEGATILPHIMKDGFLVFHQASCVLAALALPSLQTRCLWLHVQLYECKTPQLIVYEGRYALDACLAY